MLIFSRFETEHRDLINKYEEEKRKKAESKVGDNNMKMEL